MKTLKNYLFVLLLGLIGLTTFSCSEDDDTPTNSKEEVLKPSHFDIWVSIGGTSGMSKENTQLVKGINSLEAGTEIDFKGTGTDVTAKMYQHSIIKGKFYYQIPKEKDRFGKYQILNGEVKVVKELMFENNTLKDRRYTHAWTNDHTLVLMGSNGPSSKILWIKIDTDKMEILGEGELDLPTPPEGDKFNTSGIANYREDGKILYAYLYNYSKVHFFVAFIDAETMKVEKNVEEKRAPFMAGTAYGELLQRKTFFDKNGNYYIACNNYIAGAPKKTQQYGSIVRINKGEDDFDKSYKGYNYTKGKIVTVDCLNNGKVLLYIQDPEHTGANAWGSAFNCYYAVLDLASDKLTALDLPYCEGTFSQRSIVKGSKAYIGVNPEKENPCVYIYDIATGELEKGLDIADGYSFDRIVDIED